MSTPRIEPREWDELAQQLRSLPGCGPTGILSDFFGTSVRAVERRDDEQARWELSEGGSLCLTSDGTLMHYDVASSTTRLAQHANLTSPPEVSPLALMLAALAGGLLDGHPNPAPFKTLKALSPKLARAAQELLLVASCRLCG